jgi:bacteriorhodopsin
MESTWLWIGTFGMTLGAVAFLVMGLRDSAGSPDKEKFYVVTLFIPIIAAASYLAMANGQGVVEVDGRTVYWARYADWLITTPLLLLDLALLARMRLSLIAGLILADVFMIVTGVIASLSSGNLRFLWWTVSTGAFVAILAILLPQMSVVGKERPAEVAGLFRTLTLLTIVLWTAYPIVWLLGTEGFGIIGLNVEVLVFMVLDLSAKVGFGFILLGSRGALERSGSVTREAVVTAGA